MCCDWEEVSDKDWNEQVQHTALRSLVPLVQSAHSILLR